MRILPESVSTEVGAAATLPGFPGRVVVAHGPELPCRAWLEDLDAVLIATQAQGRLHERAVCYLDEIGALPGWIGATTAAGFTLHPSLNAARRARIAVRLAWHTTRAAWTVEQRADPRVVPEHRDVIVCLPDGQTVQGRILDLSKGGAKIALSSAVAVAVDASVTVGKRYATIVRAADTTIAVRFQLPFCDETFDPGVVL